MADGIGRKRTIGIALEADYGIAETTPDFLLQLIDTPRIVIQQMKAENNAALGSRYAVNATKNTIRMATVSLNMKVSENSLPLLLLQNFSIATSTVSGDSNVYRHVLTYSSTATASYTLFLQDPDRVSERAAGVKFNSFAFTFGTNGFVTVQAEGVGKFPTTWTGTNTITQPLEFVGRNVTFDLAPIADTYTTTRLISATINHTHNLSGEDTNFNLGNQDIEQIYTTEDRFEIPINKLFPNFTFRNHYANNDKLKARFNITDTDRFVSGSVASTNPSIVIEYPACQTINWQETGGLGEILKEEPTLLALDDVGTPNSPAVITVTNNVSSY